MSKPVEVEFLMKDKLTPGMNKAEREALELRNTVRLLEAELERLRLAGETAAPNLDQSANIAQIHALEKQLEELRGKLKLLQEESESVQVTPADMPNAQRQFNGLHNSIQQMAREMPSLAMGPQMFFLAISNNLPIFTDELARARKEYDELQKSGKKGTPVWKQVLSSLFSWQTAMTTGIMLLVMYGDEIWDWTKNLFSAKKGVDEYNISLKEMTEIEKDGRAQMVRTRFELKSVIDEIKNFTGSKEQEKAKVEELNRKYGESFGYYKTLSEWYDTIIQKSEDYVQSLFLQAKVQNLVKKASEVDEKIAEAEAKDESEFDTWWGYGGKVDRFFSSDQSYKQNNNGRWKKKEEIERLKSEYNGYILAAENLTKERLKLEQKSGIGGHIDPKQPGKNPEAEAKQRLATERRLAQDLAALQAENRKEEIDRMQAGTEKKLAQIEYDYNARKEEINRQEADWKRENKEAGLSTGDNGLTREQQDELEKARASNTESRKKAEADVYREEAEAMRDYLKEYGTFQQQKLAIAEEYAEKIRKAQSQGERLTLEKQRDAAVHKVDMEALTQKIDWGAAFGDLTGLLADQMKNLLGELKQYVKTDEFKKTGAADQQVVYDAIERIQSMLPGGNGTLDFARLQTQMHALGDAVTRVQNAELQQEAAFIRLKAAQTDYNKALESGNQAEIERTKIALQMAQSSSISADEEYLNATSEMKALAGEVKSASRDTVDGLNMVSDGLHGFASGTLQGSFEGIQNMLTGLSKLNIGGKVGDAISRMSETLSSAGVIGQIISAILSILDLLKDGIGPIISSLIDTIFNAITGILDNILSGDLFKQIGGSLVNGIGGLLNTVSFGGFNKLFGIGGNAREVQAAIDRLTDRNEKLQTSIEDLTDTIKASKGTKSVEAYRDAYKYQKETNANYLQIAKEQARYSGSHHSWNYYWGGFNQAQIDKLSGQIGRQWDGNLWSLSPEEMKALRSNVDMWTQIQNTGKGGYGGRLTEKLDDYIDQAGKLEELTDQLYEGLTGISFDGMYSSFIDNLMNMKYGAKDAAEDISEYFMRAMLSNKIGEMYSDKLKGWWEKFGKAMEDNELTEAERNALMEEYMQYMDEALALRDNLAAATGYDKTQQGGTSQSAKAGGFTAMTQDQGTKLEGMFTGGLQHWSSMDDRLESVVEKMDTAEGHLARIAENTGVSAGHLGELKEVIKKMIRDGLKVK
ncbi:viral A-type inclusion protein [Bacteroides fragilis]|uniref:viral A-type inclusion protein n=1 Tax=Bacteroides fragilis TaxID=817 RepID=UPI00200D0AEA|nr:viral A-type inclusion protein [Bacteroides fragilis]MCL0355062.1 viral A-type inclusion protein [Bacteroides fragilis]MCL0359203.1 viral A-type inclusion protein [Bacteroides fragilis]MCL0383233.1 viral A-type inclusion protein [Bacteroides fragilis]MCL0396910.1 viral A-type inclusion protein [Bacteroides fragilis]MCL0400804.1 viral A-type inclusion protein [Bacteroides fragilis]